MLRGTIPCFYRADEMGIEIMWEEGMEELKFGDFLWKENEWGNPMYIFNLLDISGREKNLSEWFVSLIKKSSLENLHGLKYKYLNINAIQSDTRAAVKEANIPQIAKDIQFSVHSDLPVPEGRELPQQNGVIRVYCLTGLHRSNLILMHYAMQSARQ